MEIGILDANIEYCNDLCSLVKELDYSAIPIHTLENLSKYLKKNIRKAVILNIDTMGLSNRDIRDLSRKNREVTFLCISESRFHPDFKEAIRNHIFACLNKPIDADELNYFLKSIKKSKIL
jgi:DNA-binding NtrC family response regulator